MTPLTPRGLARLAGVSTDTLRHYERQGLLTPVRTSNGYRRYSPADVHRVGLIRRALVVGFSLRELSRVLVERERGGAPCRSVRALVGQRLADLDTRLKELRVLRTELQALLRDWDEKLAATPRGARAHLLEQLPERDGLEGVVARATTPSGLSTAARRRPAPAAAPRRR